MVVNFQFCMRTTTTSGALVYSVDSGCSFFCKTFFPFLELFLVSLLHGEVFLPLKKREVFKLNQQLKGTMENSPIKVTHFQRLDSHSKLLF